MEKNFTIHFKLYGREVTEMIRQARTYARINGMYWFEPRFLATTAEGEAVYDTSTSRYPTNFTDPNTKMRQIGSMVLMILMGFAALKAARAIAYRKFFLDYSRYKELGSIVVLRSFEKADEPLKLQDCPNATIRQFALLGEALQGYKTRESLKKLYPEAAIKAVLGEATDPLNAAAIQVLLQQIEELRQQKAAAYNEFCIEKRRQEEVLTAEWDAKIHEVEQQIAACRNMSEAV